MFYTYSLERKQTKQQEVLFKDEYFPKQESFFFLSNLKIGLLAILGPFLERNDRFPKSIICFKWWNPHLSFTKSLKKGPLSFPPARRLHRLLSDK